MAVISFNLELPVGLMIPYIQYTMEEQWYLTVYNSFMCPAPALSCQQIEDNRKLWYLVQNTCQKIMKLSFKCIYTIHAWIKAQLIG